MKKSETIQQQLNELIKVMPITDIWSAEFEKDCRPYKLYEHCLINVISKVGGLLAQVEMADHYGMSYQNALTENADDIEREIAYALMSLLKAASSFPLPLDISQHVVADLQRRGILE